MQINFRTKTSIEHPVGIESLDKFTIVVKKEFIEGDDCYKCCLEVGSLNTVVGFIFKKEKDSRLKIYDMVNVIKENEALFLKFVNDWQELSMVEAKAKWDKTIIEDNVRKELSRVYIKKRLKRDNNKLSKKMAIEEAVETLGGLKNENPKI